MTEFTPLSAIMGGALIGLSAVLLLLVNGKTAGISGIVGSLMVKPKRVLSWQTSFIVGLIIAPAIISPWFEALPSQITIGWAEIIIAGLLVGFGARLGSGCTSGHGICGMGRLSTRSIVATCVFMLTAVMTVFIHRHVIGG